AVAQVDENHAALVAIGIHPSGERNGLADIGGAKLMTGMGAVHGRGAECSRNYAEVEKNLQVNRSRPGLDLGASPHDRAPRASHCENPLPSPPSPLPPV